MNFGDLGGLVQNVVAANENLIRTSINLSGTMFNKAVEAIGLRAKEEAVIPAAPPITITESSSRWQWKYVVLAGAVGVGGFLLYRRFRRPARRDAPYVKDFEQDVIYLFQFPRMYSIPNISPFCLKLETWFRFMDINYKMVDNVSFFHRTPEGTLPYVELNGEVIPDSSNCIDVLPHKLGRKSTEAHLSPEQKASCRAFETMTEMSLNYCTAKYRYEHVGELLQMIPRAFGFLQPLVNLFIKHTIAPLALKRIRDVGIGKHSNELVEKISFSDLQALSDQLGSQHYLFGMKPTRADAALFSALCFILYAPFDNNPQRRFINENFPNLRDYADRIRQRYFPDWVEITSLLKTNTDWKRRRPASRPASSVQ